MNEYFKIIKPNHTDQDLGGNFKIFLAGSIDQGKADKWQDSISEILSKFPVTVFNPRRDDWDDQLTQDISNPNFKYQVDWELDHMNQADLILMYFDPNGKSPITLSELGLHAKDGKLVVCCPDRFWRKGNIQVVCKEYNIMLCDTMEEFIEIIKQTIREKLV